MGPATDCDKETIYLITTSSIMAEELTPTKQDKFDESHELLTQSLTPKDDVKDYEIHICEVQLEKLKQILSDDSSPFRDLQDFMPSTLTFPDQLL